MASDIEKLEIALAHQQQMLDELNDIVTAQSKDMDVMKKRLSHIQDKMEDIVRDQDSTKQQDGETATEFASRNKPPHY